MPLTEIRPSLYKDFLTNLFEGVAKFQVLTVDRPWVVENVPYHRIPVQAVHLGRPFERVWHSFSPNFSQHAQPGTSTP